MRLWKRAAGALKDRCSIWVARLAPHGPCRNPDLEMVIIKATSHDEQCMDYKSIQRVFRWLRTSPLYLKPILYTLSMRMEKTRSWVVALKGLMLIHGIFCFDIPIVQKMGRLPFDLSHFSDGNTSLKKEWGFVMFVRAYFAYLDHKSIFMSTKAKKLIKNRTEKETEETLLEELQNLEKMQGLIDMLLQIKPFYQHMNVVLILEAMDCIIDDIFAMYETFRRDIDRVLLKIFDIGGKVEAGIGLRVVEKAEMQGEKLFSYYDFCKDIGVVKCSECPKILRVPKKDIHELQRISNGSVSKNQSLKGNKDKVNSIKERPNKDLGTVVTDQWVVFDDDIGVSAKENFSYGTSSISTTNPFLDSYSLVPYIPVYNHVLPDLISL